MGAIHKLAMSAAISSALGLMTSSAFAGTTAPYIPSWEAWLSVNSSGDLISEHITNNNGSNDFSVSGNQTLTDFSVDWNLMMNPDPYIDGFVTITNLSSSAQNFTVNLSLPVTPAFAPGLMGGSIDATVYDLNGNGSAMLQPQGSTSNPIYFGRIDGANTTLVMFAQVLNCLGVNCSANSGESQMPAYIPVSGVNTSIGTRLQFNLSGNDRVTFATHFEVLPVPVPASAWLMGSALLGLVGARRRR